MITHLAMITHLDMITLCSLPSSSLCCCPGSRPPYSPPLPACLLQEVVNKADFAKALFAFLTATAAKLAELKAAVPAA